MEDVLPYVAASVMIILIILVSIKMQISMMEGLNDLTVENNDRLGYKSAGSFQFLTKGERFGVLTREQYDSLKDNCGQSVDGFSGEPLTLGDAGCSEVITPLPAPLMIVEPEAENSYKKMKVGETSEGFN